MLLTKNIIFNMINNFFLECLNFLIIVININLISRSVKVLKLLPSLIKYYLFNLNKIFWQHDSSTNKCCNSELKRQMPST